MGNWWTGGRWSDVEGGTWLKESKGEMQGGMWSEARGGVRWEEAKNGVRNHFGRHFTNIVYIIKKMF